MRIKAIDAKRILLVATLLSSSCGSKESSSRSQASTSANASLEFTLEEDQAGFTTREIWTYGTAEGAHTEMLSQVLDAAFDSRGYVYVLDYGNGRVLRLTPDGLFANAIGQSGAGPGEFRRPTAMAIGKRHVYVYDAALKRINTFDLEGDFQQSVRFDSNVASIPQMREFGADSLLIGLETSRTRGHTHYLIDEVAFVVGGAVTGRELAQVSFPVRDAVAVDGTTTWVVRPLVLFPTWDLNNDSETLFQCYSAEDFSIDTYDLGSRRKSGRIHLSLPERVLSNQDKEQIRAWWLATMPADRAHAVSRSLDVPQVQPYLRKIMVDSRTGLIWCIGYRHPALLDLTSGIPIYAFSATAGVIAYGEAAVEFLDVEANRALQLVRNEEGVEEVRVVAIEYK